MSHVFFHGDSVILIRIIIENNNKRVKHARKCVPIPINPTANGLRMIYDVFVHIFELAICCKIQSILKI